MNVLVTGANGQLGSEIQELSENYKQFTFFFESSTTLDITKFDEVKSFIVQNNIQAVINCAAYTLVDKAEQEEDKAKEVNVTGIKNLIVVLEETQGKLIHFSTDYVFNGENKIPYTEEDITSPIGIYGNTKREGENVILKSDIEALIIRTSWLYASYGSNFVKTMIRLGKEKQELNVINDQKGSPTYARDLAKACLQILSKSIKIDKKSRIYHYSNEGVISWYDFAKEIMKIAEIECKVTPITTKEYPTLAQRPKYSVLNTSKIKRDFNIEIPYWKDSLKDCIFKLQNKE